MCILPNDAATRRPRPVAGPSKDDPAKPRLEYDFPPHGSVPAPRESWAHGARAVPRRRARVLSGVRAAARRGKSRVQLSCHSVRSTLIDVAGVIAITISHQSRVGGFQPPSWWIFSY